MQNLENQKLVNEQRAKYMNHELSHHDYYIWLAKFIGANKSMLPVSQSRINQSTDEYLNDIPLKLWDNQDYLIRRLAYNKGLAWSESDTVCVLKTIANDNKRS